MIRTALVSLLLVLAGCSGDPPATPQKDVPEPTTAEAMVELAGQTMGSDATDVETRRIRPPECPPDFLRVFAGATFDGRHLGLQLEAGACPDSRPGHHACHGEPRLRGHAVELRTCFARTLADGRSLVAGRQDVYQEGSYLLAVVTGPRYLYTVTTSREPTPEFTLEELSEIAQDPRVAALADEAYADELAAQ